MGIEDADLGEDGKMRAHFIGLLRLRLQLLLQNLFLSVHHILILLDELLHEYFLPLTAGFPGEESSAKALDLDCHSIQQLLPLGRVRGCLGLILLSDAS